MNKKTLLLGATTNPQRTAYTAAHRLTNAGYELILLGIKKGEVAGIPIQHGLPKLENIHTITLYLRPEKQSGYYNYIIDLKPERIIFNPGTENPELVQLATENGIGIEIACTLVLLSLNQY